MQTPSRLLLLLAAVAVAFGLNSAQAQTIISAGNFVSNGGNQPLNGTQIGITTNQPGGNWVWGAGWNYAPPQVNATWLGGSVQNAAWLAEENTVLSLTLASTGGYTKPTEFTLSSRLIFWGNMTNSIGALGFWSTQPTQSNAASSLVNYTGFTFDEAGSLKLYAAGTQQGSAVALGALSEGVWYTLSYNVNTATGDVSDIIFNGSGVADFSTTAFSNSATAFVGAATGAASRAAFDDLLVVAVPEPSTGILLLGGGLFLASLCRFRGVRS